MKKQILFSLALLIAVSCVPVQAAESKSGWVIFKNSAKILVGAWLTYKGLGGIMGAFAVKGVLEATRAEQDQEIERLRQQARDQGQNMEEFEAGVRIGKGVANASPAVFGVIGAGATAGGIALIYSGYKGLTEEEEQRQA